MAPDSRVFRLGELAESDRGSAALRGSEAAGALRVLESMAVAFFHLDEWWRFSYVNAEAERVLGVSRERLLGQEIWAAFPAAVDSEFERSYREAVRSGEPKTFETFYPAPLNAWYEVRAYPSPDGLAVYFLDVTTRRAAQAQAQAAMDRLALVAQVSEELAGTLDADAAVGRLAQSLVPALADWAIVTIVDDPHARPGALTRDVGHWHVDPRQRDNVARYARMRNRARGENSTVERTLSAGEQVLSGQALWTAIDRAVGDDTEARSLLDALAPAVVGYFPLHGRKGHAGVLTLVNGRSRGPFSEADLVTARDVASRAGTALDNARLFARQRSLSEGLQRSLLTPPPEPRNLQIVVRYEPAAESAQVGGDWYDAFLQPDGATVVVIGDVIGHDTAAAAAMGQLRSLLRGIAASTGDGPADVLCRVDRVLETLQVETTATVVVARFEQSDEQRDGGGFQMRWANAGHPPPMVLDPDGSVLVLSADSPDLLLGIDPAGGRTEAVVDVPVGSTVLLYTDGLVERRGQSLDEGLTRLQHLLAAEVVHPLEQLCDNVLSGMLPERPEDDIAMVAIRISHPRASAVVSG